MIVLRREDLNLHEAWLEGEPRSRWRSCLPFEPVFPGYVGRQPERLGLVYFEIGPGDQLGAHRDSAEELLYVIEGEIEVTTGEEYARVPAGALAVIPAQVEHAVRNAGLSPARCLGVYAEPRVAHRFRARVMPMGAQAFDPTAAPAPSREAPPPGAWDDESPAPPR